MVVCCVPFCKSVKGKSIGISFHEFPVSEELRSAWLRCISREHFSVNGNSNTSVVCSLHFKTEDYVSGYKIRRLKLGSIPSVFEGYPIHKLVKVPTPRRVIKRASTENEPKRQRTSTVISGSSSSIELPTVLLDKSNVLNVETTTDFNNFTNRFGLTCSRTSSSENSFSASKSVQTQEDLPLKLHEVQKNINSLRTKLWRANNKLQELQGKLDEKSTSLHYFETNEHHKILKRIQQEATDIPQSKYASFLLEQIINFKRKSPRYTSDHVKICVLWQYISPKGYNFVRREKFLKLPSKSTLKRFLGDTSTETGVTNLIKERLTQEASLLKPAEKFASLIIDEMDIKPQLQYDNKLDAFFGEPDVKKHVKGVHSKIG